MRRTAAKWAARDRELFGETSTMTIVGVDACLEGLSEMVQ